jgi:hypothetical protein
MGAPAKSASWRISYLLHPEISVVLDGATAFLRTPAQRALSLVAEVGPRWSIEDAEYSPAFNRKTSTRRLVLSGEFEGGQDPLVSRVAIIFGDTGP